MAAIAAAYDGGGAGLAAALVDPAEPAKVFEALAAVGGAQLALKAVWTTHHHSYGARQKDGAAHGGAASMMT